MFAVIDGFDRLAKAHNIAIIPLDDGISHTPPAAMGATSTDIFNEGFTPQGAQRQWTSAKMVPTPWSTDPVPQHLLQKWGQVRHVLVQQVERLSLDAATFKRRCGRVHAALVTGTTIDKSNAAAAIEQATTLNTMMQKGELPNDAEDVMGTLLQFVILSQPLSH
eukprot:COSAG01_NODE_3058_length_6654_cov_3.122636_3_plen_164_part_00